MTEEIRIYLLDSSDLGWELREPPLDEFMNQAEEQGTVYSLESFVREFNKGNIQGGGYTQIRAIEFDEDGNEIGEI